MSNSLAHDLTNYPGAIQASKDTFNTANQFLAANPVIEDEDTAREAEKMRVRLKGSLDEMESERDKKVRPLNQQVRTINETYKTAAGTVQRIYDELRARLTVYARAEEAKRLAEAAEKRRIADEADRKAREAEMAEFEAKDNAANGELDVNVGHAVMEADQAFNDAQRADREAARAERNSTVRLASGMGRVTTLRTKETLLLVDAVKAITVIGVTEKTREAILSDARAYRKLHGKLPEGVTSQTERSI
jgi:hypothetical protein